MKHGGELEKKQGLRRKKREGRSQAGAALERRAQDELRREERVDPARVWGRVMVM